MSIRFDTTGNNAHMVGFGSIETLLAANFFRTILPIAPNIPFESGSKILFLCPKEKGGHHRIAG